MKKLTGFALAIVCMVSIVTMAFVIKDTTQDKGNSGEYDAVISRLDDLLDKIENGQEPLNISQILTLLDEIKNKPDIDLSGIYSRLAEIMQNTANSQPENTLTQEYKQVAKLEYVIDGEYQILTSGFYVSGLSQIEVGLYDAGKEIDPNIMGWNSLLTDKSNIPTVPQGEFVNYKTVMGPTTIYYGGIFEYSLCYLEIKLEGNVLVINQDLSVVNGQEPNILYIEPDFYKVTFFE